jgi:pimeloyl-ACP methyl ester carboxylesterase
MPYRYLTRFITAPDGTRVAYHTHAVAQGESASDIISRPAVLLTNGIGTTENFWRYLVMDLERDHRVVHWSYRGHGQSEVPPQEDYSLRAQVEDLERVTEQMMAEGNGRAPHHVAFSMGVRVVLELYRRRPELVAAVSLVAGSPSIPDPRLGMLPLPGGQAAMARAFAGLTPLVPRLAPAVHALLTSRWAYPFGRATGMLRARAPREDLLEFFQALRDMDPRTFWLTMRGLLEAPPSWDVLCGLQVPTQIIAARNDLLVPLREMQRMRECLPGAEWLLVEDAGHAGLLEAGEEIARSVRVFRQAHGVGPAWPGSTRPGGASPRGAGGASSGVS